MRDAPKLSYVQQSDHWLKRTLVNWIEVATGRNKLTDIYNVLRETPFEAEQFFTRAIELGGLNLQYNQFNEQLIPKDGPLVFIANHSFGIIDGLVLCELAARTRGDFRILLNSRLCKDDNLNQFFLPISFEGTRDATKLNVETKRAAQQLLESGGTLIIFPAGGVATRWKFAMGELKEFAWTTFTAKIVKKSRATVLPLYFEGENSRLFHLASNLSPAARMSLFIFEVTRKVNSTIRFTLGKPIDFEDIEHIESRKALTEYLHKKTYELAEPKAQPSLSAGLSV